MEAERQGSREAGKTSVRGAEVRGWRVPRSSAGHGMPCPYGTCVGSFAVNWMLRLGL